MITLQHMLTLSAVLFSLSIAGIFLNRKNVILLCDSVACWMLGCDNLKSHISSKLGIDYGQTTADNQFTLIPVPCLGDCDKAPTMMVGDVTYRNLTPAKIDTILAECKARG